MATMKRRTLTSAALVALAGLLAGCEALTPGGDTGEGTATRQEGKKLTPEQVRNAGQITLEMADYESTLGPSRALDKNIKQFQSLYPNIKVNRVAKGFADYSKTINLQMSSNNPPDIAELNIITNPTLIRSGLLRPLDDYYQAYGWSEKLNYPKTALGILKADSKASAFGSGNWYALGAAGNMIGVYYNRELLRQLNLEVPSTLLEFENALQAAKSRGLTPIALGNLDQIPTAFAIATILTQFEDPDVISEWVYGADGATFERPGIESSFAKLAEWAAKQYIPAGANGTKDDDAVNAFVDGRALFTFSGTWRLAQIDEGLGDKGGFMLLPPKEPGGETYASGAVQSPFTISAKSQHPDIAAFFLDYLIGPECAGNNLAGGWLPFGSGVPETKGGATAQEAMKSWADALRTGVLIPSLDWAAPAMGDTEFPAMQQLIAGKTTPGKVVEAMQKTWSEYHEK